MRIACIKIVGGIAVNTREKPLRVLCRGWVDVGFGSQLLGRLYEEASACVVQSVMGELSLTVFDTYAPPREIFAGEWPDDARVLLFSNHPAGNMTPSSSDLRNLADMPAGTGLVIVCGRRSERWQGALAQSAPPVEDPGGRDG